MIRAMSFTGHGLQVTKKWNLKSSQHNLTEWYLFHYVHGRVGINQINPNEMAMS